MNVFHQRCSLCEGRFHKDFLMNCDECTCLVCPGCARFDVPQTDVLCQECAENYNT